MRSNPALSTTGRANMSPDKPKLIYQHMPGGRGLKGTNYCYSLAQTDFSVICLPLNPFSVTQLLRPKGVKYDAAKFSYLRNASDMKGAFAVLGTSPVKKLLGLCRQQRTTSRTSSSTLRANDRV
jgi:hypothetical protein